VVVLATVGVCTALGADGDGADPPETGAAETDAPISWKTLAVGTYTLRYAMVLPDGYDPDATWPVLLALPPGAQDGRMVGAGLALYWEDRRPKTPPASDEQTP
jgi:hypothetical protein